MPLPGRADHADHRGDPLAGADAWFLTHGLPYFVPEKRHDAREALRLRRSLPRLAAVALLAAAGGVALAWATGQVSAAPAVVLTLVLVVVGFYAVTAPHARPILTWALHRTVSSLPRLLPQMTRALPLLLVFMTFLFINAEVWELAASLETGTLWLVVLLFTGLAAGFLAVRLPEEVDKADDEVDEAFLRGACRGTPLEQPCEELLADPGADPAAHATVGGFERANLVLFLVVVQFVQVLLLALGVVAVMAVAFINAQAFVWHTMAVPVKENYYGALFYATTGTMTALVIVGLVYTTVTAFRALGGGLRDTEILAAHALYWYFTAAAYSAVWFVVYVTK